MAGMCRDNPAARDALRGRVQRYVCQYGGLGRRTIALSGSTLTMTIDWEASNYGDYVGGYLGRVL
jgi:hypothetical protein